MRKVLAEVCRYLEAETGFPHAARACQREQTHLGAS